jgi:hypothetical protein
LDQALGPAANQQYIGDQSEKLNDTILYYKVELFESVDMVT